jgi:hypothetical protein
MFYGAKNIGPFLLLLLAFPVVICLSVLALVFAFDPSKRRLSWGLAFASICVHVVVLMLGISIRPSYQPIDEAIQQNCFPLWGGGYFKLVPIIVSVIVFCFDSYRLYFVRGKIRKDDHDA